MDDGNPAAGAVRGFVDQTAAAAIPVPASTSGFVETGTTIYTLCRQF
jgi:hypothetical protein